MKASIIFILAQLLIAKKCICAPHMWTYFPNVERVKYGIVMGGTKNMFEHSSDAIPHTNFSVCLAHLYCRRHDYAFHLATDLASENLRSYGNCSSSEMSAWNKIPLIKRLIEDVDVIVWMDLDSIISDDSFTIGLDYFLPYPVSNQSQCLPTTSADYFEGIYLPTKANSQPFAAEDSTHHMGTGVSRFKINDMFGASDEPFLWAAQDLNPKYTVNLNTAVIAFRRCPLAMSFLEDIWRIGEDPNYFRRFDDKWYVKKPCEGYWGWPWEQGAIWGLLSDPANSRYRRATCIRPHRGSNTLNTVKGHNSLREVSWYFKKEGKVKAYDDVFAFHKMEPLWGRFSLKRLLMRGAVGHERISKVCGLRIRAPRYGKSPFS